MEKLEQKSMQAPCSWWGRWMWLKSHLQQNLANKLLSFSLTPVHSSVSTKLVRAAKMLCYEGEFFLPSLLSGRAEDF